MESEGRYCLSGSRNDNKFYESDQKNIIFVKGKKAAVKLLLLSFVLFILLIPDIPVKVSAKTTKSAVKSSEAADISYKAPSMDSSGQVQ